MKDEAIKEFIELVKDEAPSRKLELYHQLLERNPSINAHERIVLERLLDLGLSRNAMHNSPRFTRRKNMLWLKKQGVG